MTLKSLEVTMPSSPPMFQHLCEEKSKALTGCCLKVSLDIFGDDYTTNSASKLIARTTIANGCTVNDPYSYQSQRFTWGDFQANASVHACNMLCVKKLKQ